MKMNQKKASGLIWLKNYQGKKEQVNFGRAIFFGFVGAALLLLPIAAGMPILSISAIVAPAAAMLI
jgi:hypothetical protein